MPPKKNQRAEHPSRDNCATTVPIAETSRVFRTLSDAIVGHRMDDVHSILSTTSFPVNEVLPKALRCSLLIVSVRQGTYEIVRTLLEDYSFPTDFPSDQDVDDESDRLNQDGSPLITAAYNNNRDAVELLLRHGAKLDAQFGQGESVLSQPADRHEILDILLEHGADVHHRNDVDLTPIQIACGAGIPENVRVFIKHGADVNDARTAPLAICAARGNLECMRLVLDAGAQIDQCCTNLRTALDAAITMQQVSACVLLLSRGALKYNIYEVPPIAVACAMGNLQLVHILLAHGESLDFIHPKVSPFTATAFQPDGAGHVVEFLLSQSVGLALGAQNIVAPSCPNLIL